MGKPLRVRSPADAIAAGMLLVPEDRRLHGLVLVRGRRLQPEPAEPRPARLARSACRRRRRRSCTAPGSSGFG